MRRQLTSFTIMMTAGALALAACSQGGGQQSGNTAGEEAPMGPLDKYLSVLWEGQDQTQEHYDKISLQREELMAECMAKEGFEYVPNTDSGTTVGSDDEQEGPAWDSLEFAQQYGYGVFDWPGSSGPEEVPTEEEIYVDPNEDYVNSLSPSEQEAYYATLYGEPQLEEVDGDNEEEYQYNWEDNGCFGWADNQIAQDDPAMGMWEDPEFTDLIEAMNTHWETVQNAPELTELNQKWATCMAAAGFPDFSTRDEAANSIYEAQNALYEDAQVGEEWVEPSAEAIEELRAQEIATATADWKCADEVNYTEVQQKVDFAAQQKFLDEHKTELDAMLAKYATSQNG